MPSTLFRHASMRDRLRDVPRTSFWQRPLIEQVLVGSLRRLEPCVQSLPTIHLSAPPWPISGSLRFHSPNEFDHAAFSALMVIRSTQPSLLGEMPGRRIVRIDRLDTRDASEQRDFRSNANDEQHAEFEEIPLEERDTACELVLRIVKHRRRWQAEREARKGTQVCCCIGDGVPIQREEV